MAKSVFRVLFFLTILILITTTVWANGGKEDTLVYISQLIDEQKYDEAILLLSAYMQQNPDRFDQAQKLMRKITKIRSDYNSTASNLIDIMQSDPTNQEKKLALINELESYEKNPSPAVREFITQTKEFALFTYNRAQFEDIMKRGQDEIAKANYTEATRIYETGFSLYREEFLEMGLPQETVDESFAKVADVSSAIGQFEQIHQNILQDFENLTEAYKNGSKQDILSAWDATHQEAENYSLLRNRISEDGWTLQNTFKEIASKDKNITEASFLPFAYRFILGRSTEAKLEGITGSLDALWVSSMNSAQEAIDEKLNTAMAEAHNAFDNALWDSSSDSLAKVEEFAIYGMDLVNLWAFFAQKEMLVTYSDLGVAILELKGNDYLRYSHALDIAKLFSQLAQERKGMSNTATELASFESKEVQSSSIPAVLAIKNVFIEDQSNIKTIRSNSNALAQKMSNWAVNRYGADWSRTEQGLFDGILNQSLDLAMSEEIRTASVYSMLQYNYLAKLYDDAYQELNLAKKYIDGTPSDDPALPDSIFKYPGTAINTLASANIKLEDLDKKIQNFIAEQKSEQTYIQDNSTIADFLAKVTSIGTNTLNNISEISALNATAVEQKRLADTARLEADRRINEARNALRSNNFDTANERLGRARERYSTSLDFEQNAELRRTSDATIIALAADILKAQNDLVIIETRKLINTGRDFYMTGDFENAEAQLLQARTRWSTTNTEENIEVEYWVKLVQTALSVQSGRTISSTAPLFPEMRQLLSIAKTYYNDGTSLLAKRDRTGAIKTFELARQKISEVKLVFPLNQEARVLDLMIDQVLDPPEFSKTFARMFNEAKQKVVSKDDISTAYSDLKDLEALNPKYPGLKDLIYQTEITLGFRQPPPDPKAIAEARSLVQAAKRIVDRGQMAQFTYAKTQIERALVLDPNNNEARILNDRIATYVGGNASLVLSSAGETQYNEAVSLFTSGNYMGARTRLNRLAASDPKGMTVQKVSDLDTRLKALGY